MREREFGPSWDKRLTQRSEARRQMLKANLRVWTLRVRPFDGLTEQSNLEVKPLTVFSWMKWVPKPARPLLYGGVTLAGLAAAACFGGGGPKPKPEQPPDAGDNVPNVERGLPKESEMILPLRHKSDPSRPVRLTSGPHRTNLSRLEAPWDALDLAPERVISCSEPAPADWVVVAPAAGVVKEAGKPGARNQSIVRIDHGSGLETTLVHVANIRVEEGQKVKQGQELGNPSCVVPAGGRADGTHVHAAFARGGQPAVEEIILSGWKFESSGEEKEGTATKPGETLRVADSRRCGPDEPSIRACGNKRNDLAAGAAVRAKTAASTPQVKTSEPRAKTPEPKVGDLTNPKEVGKQAIQALIDGDVDKFLQYVRPDNREGFFSDITIESALEDTQGCNLKGAEILEEDFFFLGWHKSITVVFKERCGEASQFTGKTVRSCQMSLSRVNDRWYLEHPQLQCSR